MGSYMSLALGTMVTADFKRGDKMWSEEKALTFGGRSRAVGLEHGVLGKPLN